MTRFGVVLALGLTSCHPGPATPKLTDGCYYNKGLPIVRLTGNQGDVLVPGNIKRFAVRHSVGGTTVTFSPGVLFDEANGKWFAVVDSDSRTYHSKPATAVPTFDMHVMAWGEIELMRGAPC